MVIDKDHPQIKKKATPAREQFVSFRANSHKMRVFFSAGAVRNLGIQFGSYAKFDDLGDRIHVWFTSDKKGFKLAHHDQTTGLYITNSSLIRLLIKGRHIIPGQRFLIRRCDNDNPHAKGYDLHEIIINKTIDQYQKDYELENINRKKQIQ